MKKYLFIIIFFVLLSMCINNKVESMKGKILMVIAPENFRDEELFEPMAVFENNGYAVDIASTKKGVCKGMLGAEVKVNLTIDEVDPKNYVAIVIVGGTGSPKYLWHNEKLINLVKEFYEENKTVAAICLSPVVLAEAGILKGKEATVFPAKEALEEFKKYGVKYVDKGVVRVDKIVTAKSPNYARVFGLEVLKTLE